MKAIVQVCSLHLALIGCVIAEGTSSAPPPTISIRREGSKTIVTYEGGSATLLSALSVTGSWQIVTNATSPYTVPTNSGPMMFFGLLYPECTNSLCPVRLSGIRSEIIQDLN